MLFDELKKQAAIIVDTIEDITEEEYSGGFRERLEKYLLSELYQAIRIYDNFVRHHDQPKRVLPAQGRVATPEESAGYGRHPAGERKGR